MGQMRFIVPCRDRLAPGALERAYLCGIEGVPWRSEAGWVTTSDDGERGEFVLTRNIDESGNLFFPWYVEGFGELMLPTASLMERPEPYHLVVELARGLVNQLRNQSADWRLLGLRLPANIANKIEEASQCFADAVTTTDESTGSSNAQQAIDKAATATELLMNEYACQALVVRHEQNAQLPTMLGVAVAGQLIEPATSEALLPAINTTAVELRWSELEQAAGKREWKCYDDQIEWCQAQGLRIVGGPLLQLGRRSVPDWLRLWEGDFDQLQSFVAEHIGGTVQRYQGQVQIWNCAAGMNVQTHLNLSEEQKLRLVVTAIDEIRRTDSNTPMIISFDQPWGEYLAFEDVDLSPLHFADSLIRAELGVAGIGLEINLGYWPGGTLSRTRMDISQMLDRWSVLNLPLIIFLRTPSGPIVESDHPGCKTPLATPDEEALSSAGQGKFVEQLLPVLLAKAFVQGIVWNQLSDVGQLEYPGAGLFDEQLKPKPVLNALAESRRKHLT
jgi:hypothetical protein